MKGEMKMKTDSKLRADVIDELEWDPSVNTTDIGQFVHKQLLKGERNG